LPGSVASLGTEREFAEKTSFVGTLRGRFGEFVDELILTPDRNPLAYRWKNARERYVLLMKSDALSLIG